VINQIARRGAVTTSQALVRTMVPADATLAAVVRALRVPAMDEERWTAEIDAASRRRLLKDREPPYWGRFLYRLVREVVPDRCVATGTGIAVGYVAAGLTANYGGQLVAIERDESRARVARSVVDELGLGEQTTVRVGRYADRLPVALEEMGTVDLAVIDVRLFATIAERTAPGGLLVLDGVAELRTPWRGIRADPRVTGSMTVGPAGFAVIGGVRSRHRRIPRLTVPA
jgi:predicted O-methyltransferase YrrM